jgi:hypothetical protein
VLPDLAEAEPLFALLATAGDSGYPATTFASTE